MVTKLTSADKMGVGPMRYTSPEPALPLQPAPHKGPPRPRHACPPASARTLWLRARGGAAQRGATLALGGGAQQTPAQHSISGSFTNRSLPMVCALIMLLAAQDHASTKRCHTIYRRLQGDLITRPGEHPPARRICRRFFPVRLSLAVTGSASAPGIQPRSNAE